MALMSSISRVLQVGQSWPTAEGAIIDIKDAMSAAGVTVWSARRALHKLLKCRHSRAEEDTKDHGSACPFEIKIASICELSETFSWLVHVYHSLRFSFWPSENAEALV